MREQVPGWHNSLSKKATIKYSHFKGAGALGWAPVIRLKINRGNRFVWPICTIHKKTPESQLRPFGGGYSYGHSKYLKFSNNLYGGITVKI